MRGPEKQKSVKRDLTKNKTYNGLLWQEAIAAGEMPTTFMVCSANFTC